MPEEDLVSELSAYSTQGSWELQVVGLELVMQRRADSISCFVIRSSRSVLTSFLEVFLFFKDFSQSTLTHGGRVERPRGQGSPWREPSPHGQAAQHPGNQGHISIASVNIQHGL